MPHSISLGVKDTEKQNKSIPVPHSGPVPSSGREISEELLHSLPKVIRHFFPKFKTSLRQIPDSRKAADYKLSEIMMGGISMYLLKEGSRNAFNNDRRDDNFRLNYKKLFGGIKLPHMDTVDDVYRKMDTKELEKIKLKMIV